MTKNSYLFLFSLLFSLFMMPKDVFASGYEDVPLDDASQVFDYVSGKTGSIKVSYLNFPLLNVTEKPKFYFSYVYDGANSSSAIYYDENVFGIQLKYYSPLHPFHTNYWHSGRGEAGQLGAFDFNDILDKYPYYIVFKDYKGVYYINFFHTDDIIIELGGVTSEDVSYPVPLFYVKKVEKNPPALAISFKEIYNSNNTYLFNSYTLNSSYGSVIKASNLDIEQNGVIYRPVYDTDIMLSSDTTLDSFLSSSDFYSNCSIKDTAGQDLDYTNKVDISNSSSSSDFGDLAPKSLGELIASVPGLIADLFSSFTLIGILLTYGLNSFPPVITFGLYTVFIMGIVILVVKCLK